MLGDRFALLHPKSRERHSLRTDGGVCSVGRGVAERVWNGGPLFWPFLKLGASRDIMFAERGEDVPFEIRCYAYRDGHGRETYTLNRTFRFPPERRFHEFVTLVPEAPHPIIYVGNRQHLAVGLAFDVSPRGGVVVRTGRQRLLLPGLAVRFPRLLSGSAEVHEWWDEAAGTFRIEGRVRNPLLGDVFGFAGSFTSTLEQLDGPVPAAYRPRREERRW